MTAPTPFRARISERFTCDIPVDACTTLDNRPAHIVDLSSHGAQIRMEEPYDGGTRIHIDVDGDFIWADVQWSEVDRIGVKFMQALRTDHRLMRMIEDQRRRQSMSDGRTHAAPRGFGRRAA